MSAREMAELYRKAVQSIAFNDDPAELSVATVRGYLTVALVADLFARTPEQVARAVVRLRRATPGGECLGHESTSGPIGISVYCDGSCRPRGVQ